MTATRKPRHDTLVTFGFLEQYVTERLAEAAGAEPRQECRECSEGKHGACNGTALIDDGTDVISVDCICASRNHKGVQR